MSVVEPPRKRQKQHLVADAQSTRSSTSIERRIDFTSALLSDEIVLHIFSFLSASDLSRCAEVNKTWFRLANDEQVRNQPLLAMGSLFNQEWSAAMETFVFATL